MENSLKEEETRFKLTLDRGLKLLNEELAILEDEKLFSGEIAFKLYDTYGFPFDMTKAIFSEKKIYLDSNLYDKIVKESKNQQKGFLSNTNKQKTNKFFSELE